MIQQIDPNKVPFFFDGIRLHKDKKRNRKILQTPEKVIVLDEVSFHILKFLDEEITIKEIIKKLSFLYNIDVADIQNDVFMFLDELIKNKIIGVK